MKKIVSKNLNMAQKNHPNHDGKFIWHVFSTCFYHKDMPFLLIHNDKLAQICSEVDFHTIKGNCNTEDLPRLIPCLHFALGNLNSPASGWPELIFMILIIWHNSCTAW